MKRNSGFIMSSAWFTEMGNNAHNWSSSASELFAATLVLRREQEKEEKRYELARSSGLRLLP